MLWKNDCGARELEGLPSYVETALGEPCPSSRLVEESGVRFRVPLGAAGRRPAGSTTRPRTARALLQVRRAARACSTCSATSAPGVSRAARPAPREVALRRFVGARRWSCCRRPRPPTALDASHAARRCVRCAGRRCTRRASVSTSSSLDPPAFIKRKQGHAEGQAAYRKLNQLAMQLLARDGILVSCSCSYHLPHEELVGGDPAVGARHLDASRRSSRSAARRPTIRSIRRFPRRAISRRYFCRVVRD